MGSHTMEALLFLLIYLVGTSTILYALWYAHQQSLYWRRINMQVCALCGNHDAMPNHHYCHVCHERYMNETKDNRPNHPGN